MANCYTSKWIFFVDESKREIILWPSNPLRGFSGRSWLVLSFSMLFSFCFTQIYIYILLSCWFCHNSQSVNFYMIYVAPVNSLFSSLWSIRAVCEPHLPPAPTNVQLISYHRLAREPHLHFCLPPIIQLVLSIYLTCFFIASQKEVDLELHN